jgi:hypothetical protein
MIDWKRPDGFQQGHERIRSSAVSFALPTDSWIAYHLGHLLHPAEPILLEIEDDCVDVLKPVVSVQLPAVLRCLKIAVETRLFLLFKSPFHQETPSALSPVSLCRDKKRENLNKAGR